MTDLMRRRPGLVPARPPSPWAVFVWVLLAGIGVTAGLGLGRLVAGSRLIKEWSPLWISLRASILATAVVSVAGVAFGYLLARGRFRGRGFLEAVASLPIVLPPTVLGYYLLITLGSNGVIGRTWGRVFGTSLVGNFTALVIAGSVVAFPFCMRAARASIEEVDQRLEQAARTIGLPEWRVAFQVTLPLARRGIAAGLALGYARALGDFGTTLMIGGANPGSTVTMPIALFNAAESGSRAQAGILALILLAVAVVVLIALARLGKAGI